MRVTKAIREYVEDEIYKKYQVKVDEIGKEYEQTRRDIVEHVKDIMEKASKDAEKYIASKGFEYDYGYRGCCLFSITGNIQKKKIEEANYKEKDLLRTKMREKTKQVLFDLEMGETGKTELKNVLDKITVD